MIEIYNNEFGITEKKGVPVTTSIMIAEKFNKEHKHVMEAIRNIIDEDSGISDNFRRSNFRLSFITRDLPNGGKKKEPYYEVTKKGFAFAVLGFNGKKANQFKELYVDAFEAMEGFIKNLVQCRLDFPEFTEAILMAHDEPKHYHFSNELDMINRIVLGMTAKQFRELHNIDKAKSIRPYLQAHEIKYIQLLQKADIGLIEVEKDFNKRKEILTAMYQKRVVRNQKQIVA